MSPNKTKPKAAPRKKAFTAAERSAMKERVRELRGEGAGESAVLARLESMAEPDRTMGKRVHAIIRANAPDLAPRLWYGMPAYATPGKNGKLVCFFQNAQKFKSRYSTLGFSDLAQLDDGGIWATGFALQKLGPGEEAKISALVRKAVT